MQSSFSTLKKGGGQSMHAKTFHFRFMTSMSSFMLVYVKHLAKCTAFVFLSTCASYFRCASWLCWLLLSQDRSSLSTVLTGQQIFGGDMEGWKGQMFRTHKSIGVGACSYVKVCPMEGELAMGRAGEGQVSRSHYAMLVNCI